MTRLYVNPRYREPLDRQGLTSARAFLELSGVIYCGHPDRHVARVELGPGLSAFLKKEHRVPWRDRFANAWAGFGWVSKSLRERQMLETVSAAGFGCPEVIACGEDDGRAFLLIRAETNAQDLRHALRTEKDPARRRALARRLGQTIAQLHDAGFIHGDLYAKHVLVRNDDVIFVDWQRGRHAGSVSRTQRRRELAALDATLADELATPRERLRCLCAYLQRAHGPRFAHARPVQARHPACAKRKPTVRPVAREVQQESERRQRRRSVREQRHTRLLPGTQTLVWLDGEALCLTNDFARQLGDQVPAALRLGDGPDVVEHLALDVPELGPVQLVRRRGSWPWRWLRTTLRRRPFLAPEVGHGAALFRLQRYGVPAPRLLGFGQRLLRPWRTASFLLTEPIRDAVSLGSWLASRSCDGIAARQLEDRLRHLIEGIHDAGYVLNRDFLIENVFVIRTDGSPALADAAALDRCRRLSRRRRRRDLDAVAVLSAHARSEGQVRP